MLYILCSTDSRSNKENYIDYNMIYPHNILLRIDYKCNIETMLFFSNAAFIDGYQDFISGIMDSNIGQQQHRKGEKVIFFLDYCIFLIPSFPFFILIHLKAELQIILSNFSIYTAIAMHCRIGIFSEF